MLQGDAFRTEECWSNFPMNVQQGLQRADWTHHRGIRRRHACEEPPVHWSRETLARGVHCLWKYKVRINPEKCSFGVASEKFLCYLVTQQGIETNPDQTSAILHMKSPTCIKKVQMMHEHLAALNRFLSRSTVKYRSFFQAIKNMANFAGMRNAKHENTSRGE